MYIFTIDGSVKSSISDLRRLYLLSAREKAVLFEAVLSARFYANPPQQAIVIDRMHSGARRFVVLDFGAPVLLTDMIIPSCTELVSFSINIWIRREDTDGQRLVVASDIGVRTLVVSDLQPSAICRYLKVIRAK